MKNSISIASTIKMTGIGEIVKTPYGKGRILETREIHYLIEPLDWEIAGSVFSLFFSPCFVCFVLIFLSLSFQPHWFHSGQKPLFYIKKGDISPHYLIGDLVQTIYGSGVIDLIRGDGVHVITVQSWKLANETTPKLFVQAEAIRKVFQFLFFSRLIFS